jgi:hypothetical protein
MQFYTRLIEKAIVAAHSNPATPTTSTAELTGPSSARSPLLGFLDEMTQNAFKLFYDHLHDTATELLRTPPSPPDDLSVPSVVTRMLINLKDVMTAFDGSLMMPLPPSRDPTWKDVAIKSTTTAKDREIGFAPILAAMVDPLIQACTASSEGLRVPIQRGIYMVNCLLAIQSALQSFLSFTKRRLELLDAQLDVHFEIIIASEVRFGV